MIQILIQLNQTCDPYQTPETLSGEFGKVIRKHLGLVENAKSSFERDVSMRLFSCSTIP